MSPKRSIISSTLLFVLVAFLAWIGYHLTPPIWDDISYHFQIGEEGITTDLISSWPQVWESIWNHRYVHAGHGRLANALLIITIYIGSKGLLDILNAIVFSLFIFGSTLLCLRKVTCWSICIVLFTLLLMLPSPDRVLFWASAAYNYLWGGTIMVCFLYLLRKQIEQMHTHKWEKIACLILAFLCGWMHEALGLPLICGFSLYYAWQYLSKKNPPPRQIIYYVAALCIGSALVLSSPAIFSRAGNLRPSINNVFENAIFSTGVFVLHCWLSILLFLVALLKKFKWNDMHIFWFSYLLPNLVITCCFGVQGAYGGAQFYTTLVMALFLLDKWRKSLLCLQKRAKCLICILLALACSLFYQRNYSIKKQIARALRLSEVQAVTVIDGYSSSNLPGWIFYGCLPQIGDTKLATQLQKLYSLKNNPSGVSFITIFNVFVKDKSIYDLEKNLPDNTFQVFRRDSIHYIRAPKNYVASLSYPSQYAVTHSGERVSLRMHWHNQAKWASLLSLFGKKTGIIGDDFYQGYHYTVVPDEQNEYSSITLLFTHVLTGESCLKTLSLKDSH